MRVTQLNNELLVYSLTRELNFDQRQNFRNLNFCNLFPNNIWD